MCSAWFSVLGKMENRRGTCPHENDISRYVSVFGTFSSHVVCETLCGCGKTPGSRSSLKEGMSVWAHSFRRISDHHGREGKVSGAIHPWQWVSVAAYSYHSGQEAERGRVEARQGYALKAPPPAIHFFQWFTWFLSIQACKHSEYYWIALRQAELPRRGSPQTSQAMKEAKSELPRRNDRDWAI